MMKSFATLLILILLAGPRMSAAQEGYSVVIDPPALTLAVGDSAAVAVRIVDAAGMTQESAQIFYFSRARRALEVDRATGMLRAILPGEHTVIAGGMLMQNGERVRISGELTVTVPYPPVRSLAFAGGPAKVYTDTRTPIAFDVVDAMGMPRDNVAVRVTSSNDQIASIDAFGYLEAHAKGSVTLLAEAEGVRARQVVEVLPNPVARLDLTASATQVRTGDVVALKAAARDAAGRPVTDAPITYTFAALMDDGKLGPASSGQIEQDGRFVAEKPGLYTILAASGNTVDQIGIRVTPREAAGEIELVGKGIVGDVFTSDLWVWEGVDGRDYAVTGTWGANGEAYFWDVTNDEPVLIDTVTVDARTVNDVKVSEDGRVCVISREGASNRRNGLVILDCSNPYDVRILSMYDENLTGGVHNVFIYKNHVYALSAGQRYDIINIEDPTRPHRVGSFELDTPGHSIHDVWVEDGIAYSSNWSDGVVMVDVGNGIAGGSPEHPVMITSYAYPSGWNHAAFPYHDKKTGKRYIIAGDEHFIPSTAGNMLDNEEAVGWVHFIDVTDVNNPKEVARYEVPEAGTHNLWVQGDTLYVAYYQGGLRAVDISGDLMGNLYDQGREIAVFRAADEGGKIANSPMAWGPQAFKGKIFFSDMNSGLWVVRLKQEEKKPDL
ncbi:MAG: hypothetical protein R2834_09690 [Rhodothermales bacterium]